MRLPVRRTSQAGNGYTTAMHNRLSEQPVSIATKRGHPVPIVALDVGSAREALDLVDRLPAADFFKVGLQLYTAEGPEVVRALVRGGKRVFLDLKLHDIPNTVAGAVASAASLGVDILTIHTSGGAAMLDAAAEAAARTPGSPRLFGVTVLTSLSAADIATAWGREDVSVEQETARLARLAAAAALDGVVCAVPDVARIRSATRPDFPVLTPGIRLRGDDAGDQSRIATPRDAADLNVDYIVVGRSVTSAADPAATYERIVGQLTSGSSTQA